MACVIVASLIRPGPILSAAYVAISYAGQYVSGWIVLKCFDVWQPLPELTANVIGEEYPDPFYWLVFVFAALAGCLLKYMLMTPNPRGGPAAS
jgi:hypothetical protein